MLLFLFAMGASIGSFLTVVIYRTWHGDSVSRGRSYCDHCKAQISAWDNIPILSFLLLRGKSRCCKKSIDWTYPVVELTTGLLFVWWGSLGFTFFSLTQTPLQVLQPFYWLVVGILLLIIFFADIMYYIIPDFASLALLILTILYRSILVLAGIMRPVDFLYAILSGLIASALFYGLYRITRRKGIGFGDVKLVAVLGLILGFPKTVPALFLAFVIGGLVASVLLVLGKKRFGQILPFGPFLILSTCISLLWGNQLWSWYWSLMGA